LQADYIQPTPMSRLRALLPALYPPALLLGGGAVITLYARHVVPLPLCEAAPWLRLFAVLAVLAVLPPAMFMLLRGWRTLRHGQYPPPGTPVFFRRPILRGLLAKMQGVVHLALAGLLFGVMVYLAVRLQLPGLLFEPCIDTADSALAACRQALAFRN
jgi:hypothetical protein